MYLARMRGLLRFAVPALACKSRGSPSVASPPSEAKLQRTFAFIRFTPLALARVRGSASLATRLE